MLPEWDHEEHDHDDDKDEDWKEEGNEKGRGPPNRLTREVQRNGFIYHWWPNVKAMLLDMKLMWGRNLFSVFAKRRLMTEERGLIFQLDNKAIYQVAYMVPLIGSSRSAEEASLSSVIRTKPLGRELHIRHRRRRKDSTATVATSSW